TSVFFEKIRATLEAKEFKPHDQMIDRLLDQGYASTDISSALIHLLQSAGSSGTEKKPAAPMPAGNAGARGPAAFPVERAPQPAPEWAKRAASPKAAVPKPRAADENEPSSGEGRDEEMTASRKAKYDRPARTGREPGKATIFLNVGRKQLITPADIVGKIAGVTRLPADIVGAIDIHQRHTLADVAEEHAAVVVKKLAGIKLKGISLEPALAGSETA
ncbi:MAG: hypothetical protein RIQ93_2802, partial [Verrucomicrobiota bacterium]